MIQKKASVRHGRKVWETAAIVLFCLFVLAALQACTNLQLIYQAADLELLQGAQTEQDRLPERLTSTIHDIDLSSTRLVGTHANNTVWAARHEQEAGWICILNLFAGQNDNWVSAMGCNSIVHFLRSGISVTLESGSHFSSAILIPAGYEKTAEETLPNAVVMKNLILFDSPDAIAAAKSTHGTLVSIPAGEQALRNDALQLVLP